jgi:PiT family inorganic phosphate transporter
MTEIPGNVGKETLDKDLDKIVRLEEAAGHVSRGFARPGFGVLFIAAAAIFAALYVAGEHNSVLIVAAAMLGGYMALNIGANDVANNVGPAVGSKACRCSARWSSPPCSRVRAR